MEAEAAPDGLSQPRPPGRLLICARRPFPLVCRTIADFMTGDCDGWSLLFPHSPDLEFVQKTGPKTADFFSVVPGDNVVRARFANRCDAQRAVHVGFARVGGVFSRDKRILDFGVKPGTTIPAVALLDSISALPSGLLERFVKVSVFDPADLSRKIGEELRGSRAAVADSLQFAVALDSLPFDRLPSEIRVQAESCESSRDNFFTLQVVPSP